MPATWSRRTPAIAGMVTWNISGVRDWSPSPRTCWTDLRGSRTDLLVIRASNASAKPPIGWCEHAATALLPIGGELVMVGEQAQEMQR